MSRLIMFLLIVPFLLVAQNENTTISFKITIAWDELAMEGEAEGILQYYHNGQIEIVRGSLNKPSSDGNIKVQRTKRGGSQEFLIKNATGKLINIWIANILMDEDFATKDDYLMLSNSNATVYVEDLSNNRSYKVSLPGKAPGLVFRSGAIVDGTFHEFLEMFQQQRLYTVSLIDAVKGTPLSNVNVEIRDRRTDETISAGLTDEGGSFREKIEYGKFTATFSKEGYITSTHDFEMDISELPVSLNFAMSPHIKKYRIVLTWGTFPKDLDAHLSGPKPEGGSFHIWWNQKTLISGKNFLDRDDTDRYGPETITIYKPAQGEYTYGVHNYTGRNQRGNSDLSMSGARVDVYADGKLQNNFIAPANKRGNMWKVFNIDTNQRVVPINVMYDQNISSRVFD